MRAHLAYLRYVLRHKWFVLLACRKIGCSLWRGLVHDLSKFSRAEWGPYVRTFYAPDGSSRYYESKEFDKAWLHHQHANPHHWQHWLFNLDSGVCATLPMPQRYVREMVADWIGCGMALGKPDVVGWYHANASKMKLHPNTRLRVEQLIAMIAVERLAERSR